MKCYKSSIISILTEIMESNIETKYTCHICYLIFPKQRNKSNIIMWNNSPIVSSFFFQYKMQKKIWTIQQELDFYNPCYAHILESIFSSEFRWCSLRCWTFIYKGHIRIEFFTNHISYYCDSGWFVTQEAKQSPYVTKTSNTLT